MRPLPFGLLQASAEEDTTVLAVVVLVILAGVAYLIARAAIDKVTGAHQESAVYQLARDGTGALVLPLADQDPPGERVELREDEMRTLIDALDARNEMRLHALVLADGDEVPFEQHSMDDEVPRAVLLEDSRGLVRISVAGLVEARPPLDDAVQRDLLEVLGTILGTEIQGTSGASTPTDEPAR